MELTVLGSGSCVPTKSRSCSSYYMKIKSTHILLDVGCGTLRRMVECGIDYRQIDYIFCTHTHPDHVADLVPLLMALQFTPHYKKTRKLTIVGPEGFRNFMQTLAVCFSERFVYPKDFEVDIIELVDQSMNVENFTLLALSMAHSRSANGYRICSDEKIFAYSGDTGLCENVIQLMSQADLALVECSFPDEEPVKGHLTPCLAGQVAQQAHCKKLLLTHFYPMMDEIDVLGACRTVFTGHVEKAKDGQLYKI